MYNTISSSPNLSGSDSQGVAMGGAGTMGLPLATNLIGTTVGVL